MRLILDLIPHFLPLGLSFLEFLLLHLFMFLLFLLSLYAFPFSFLELSLFLFEHIIKDSGLSIIQLSLLLGFGRLIFDLANRFVRKYGGLLYFSRLRDFCGSGISIVLE